jgi:hypothetical protein
MDAKCLGPDDLGPNQYGLPWPVTMTISPFRFLLFLRRYIIGKRGSGGKIGFDLDFFLFLVLVLGFAPLILIVLLVSDS